MAKTSKAQLKAVQAYRKRNPEATSYRRSLNTVKRFFDPKGGTKFAEAIEWAKKDGCYYNDVKEIKKLIDKLDD